MTDDDKSMIITQVYISLFTLHSTLDTELQARPKENVLPNFDLRKKANILRLRRQATEYV